ncbi:hypothetical protein IMW75_11750 [Pseudomonas gregormendelii]|uniref:Uncharacterized protein n=2 Tax=Pseudomonas gregormendelii TaxID=1628277 RepID=A0ABS3AFJ5_9PSED|nr:hypothetical protein [Pseudomonas gregormendelii]
MRATTNSSRPFTALYDSENQPTPKPLTLLKKLMNLFKSDDAQSKKSSLPDGSDIALEHLYADILNPHTKRTLKDAFTFIERVNKFLALPSPETAREMGFESSGTAKGHFSRVLDYWIGNLRELLELSDDRLAIQLTMTRAIVARTSLQKVKLDATPDITDISPPPVT